MKKSILLLFLFFCMMLGGCGNSEEQELETTETAGPTEDDFSPKKDILNCDTYDNRIQFGINVIEVPCKFSVLLDEGAVIMDERYSVEYLVDAQSDVEIPLELYGSSFSVRITNEWSDIKKASDCMVTAILGITSPMLTLPQGIQAGVSNYDAVSDSWGQGQVYISEEDEDEGDDGSGESEFFTCHYYRDGIPAEKLYAFEENVSSDDIIDIGGYKYCVTYNRNTGIISNIDAYFNQKRGINSWENLTYIGDGGKVIFEILKDSYIADDKNNLTYCIENIDGVDYIIGVGVGNVLFKKDDNLMEPDEDTDDTDANTTTENTEGDEESQAEGNAEPAGEKESRKTSAAKASVPANQLAREFLTFGKYDFSEDYVQNESKSDALSYMGKSKKDNVYLAVNVEQRKKAACSIVYYMHPVNSYDKISSEAVTFMKNYIARTRNTLEFQID